MIGAALACVGALAVLGHFAESRKADADFGLTTEIALLVMFAIGVLCIGEFRPIATVVAGTVMVLLQSKDWLHGLVRRIGEPELREIARLVLIGLVILPVLPNRDMGFFNVLNPFSIWLMVVLIVGLSLAAYLAGKFIGGGGGLAVGGLLGGLISSTAATASLARRSTAKGACGLSLAAMTVIASAVVFLRVIIEIVIAAPSHLASLLPPVVIMLLWFAVVAAILYRIALKRGNAVPEEAPPAAMKSAIFFGLLYAVVLLVVSAAKEYFGNSGLYVASLISGLTDMDAITLSTAQLVNNSSLDPAMGARMILLAGLANLAFKMMLVATLGAKAFIRPCLLALTCALAGGGVILFFVG
jgi:uncharacterized membrane protein (DUF4010 family)